MNQHSENKRTFLIIILGVIILTLFSTYVVSNAWVYFNTGASKKDILLEAEKSYSNHTPKFRWIDNGNEGRKVEDYLKARISRDYSNAWYYLNLQHINGYSPSAELYFTKENIKHQKELLSQETKTTTRIERTDIEHEIDFHLYSLDGQIIAFTDSACVLVEEVFDMNDKIIHTRKIEGVYDVVMIYQDENWHIKHLVPRNLKPYVPTKTEQESLNTNIYTLNKNTQFSRDSETLNPKGINYYPKDAPWEMWENFSIETIQNDLRIMDSLGINTVRIFLGYEEFGKGYVDYEYLDHFKIFLDEAETLNIAVIPTLFDFVNNYQLANWAATDRQLETILTTYKNHPAIFAWDIKNEPNLDFKNHGKENVLAWLEFILERAKMYDPNHMLTIGWSHPDEAHYLFEQQDFITFHYYDGPIELGNKIDSLQSQVNKPLMLGEFGLSTYNSYLFPGGHFESEQALYYQEIKKLLQSKGDIPFISWTLYDFEEVPSKVVGNLPWRKNPQKQFGIINSDGNPKPAASIFNSNDNSEEIVITFKERYLKPFYISIIIGIFFVIVCTIVFWKRKHLIKSNIFKIRS